MAFEACREKNLCEPAETDGIVRGRLVPGSARSLVRSRFDGVLQVPFVTGFLVTAWVAFLSLVRQNGWIAPDLRAHIGYIPAQWTANPIQGFISANVGIVVQHSWGQIIYISLILLIFGTLYELREGTLRTIIVFYGASVAGIATLTFVVLTTSVSDAYAWSQHVSQTSWSGASVGCFGLLGAYLATHARPWWFVGAWAVYEIALEWTLVPGLAVAMHIVGFLFGFTVSRIANLGSFTPRPTPQRRPVAVPDESD